MSPSGFESQLSPSKTIPPSLNVCQVTVNASCPVRMVTNPTALTAPPKEI